MARLLPFKASPLNAGPVEPPSGAPLSRSTRAATLLWSLICGALFLLAFWTYAQDKELGFLEEDTEEYSTYAHSILAGELLTPLSPSKAPRGLYIRPPGYPAFLALASIFPGTEMQQLMLLHSLLFLGVLVGLAFSLRGIVHPIIAALALSLSSFRLHDFFRANTAEWVSFCAAMAVIALCIAVFRRRAPSACLGLGLSSALLILIKPAFLFLTAVAPVAGFLASRSRGLLYASAGLLPLLIWCSLNNFRTGSFTLAHQSGYAFVYVASTLGQAAPDATDEPHLKLCLELLNAKVAEGFAEPDSGSRAWTTEQGRKVQGQLLNLTREGVITWPEANSCGSVFSKRVIAANAWPYFLRTIREFFFYGMAWAELLILFSTLFLLRKDNAFTPLAAGAGAGLVLYAGNLFAVCASQVIIPRYYALSANILLLPALILLWVWARRVLSLEDSGPRTSP